MHKNINPQSVKSSHCTNKLKKRHLVAGKKKKKTIWQWILSALRERFFSVAKSATIALLLAT